MQAPGYFVIVPGNNLTIIARLNSLSQNKNNNFLAAMT